MKTQVKPTLRARKAVIRNGQVAHLEGEIPGPRDDDVTIVIQVRQGKGWLAFRRYRTRDGGRFEAEYPFHRTTRPTTYEFRAQVLVPLVVAMAEGRAVPGSSELPPSPRRCCSPRSVGGSARRLRTASRSRRSRPP